MISRALSFVAALTALTTLAWSTAASAGIIVTVGKFSAVSEQDDHDTNLRPKGRVVDENEVVLPDAPMPSPEASAEVASPAEDGGLGYDDLADDFGACGGGGEGLRYCDDGYGAGPGAGAAGGVDDQAIGPDDPDEIVVMGCDAGGQGAAPVALALLVLLGFALRRRRPQGI